MFVRTSSNNNIVTIKISAKKTVDIVVWQSQLYALGVIILNCKN